MYATGGVSTGLRPNVTTLPSALMTVADCIHNIWIQSSYG